MQTLREALDSGWGLYQRGDMPGAERAFRRAAEIDASSADAWYLLGVAEMAQRKDDEAESSCRRTLELAPFHVDARNNLGVILLTKGKPADAEACFREVLRIRPDHADALSNLGNTLQMLGQVDESLDCYDRALRLRPDHIDANLYRGHAMLNLGRIPEAIRSYEEVIRIAPLHARARVCLGMAHLLTGDFKRGWEGHEWRFRCPGAALLPSDRPCWDGSPLRGRSILLYADHGLGDGIQFIRYAREVEKRGGRTIVTCQRPLERILATCRGVHRIAPEGTPITDFDVYIPVMSLPSVLGTTLATIPAEVPYLHPDESDVAHWRDELGRLSSNDEFKVGVAWQGNPDHGNDRERSFRLDRLEPLARVPRVRLFSLQKGAGSEQIAALDGRFELVELGSRLDDLMDTAAVMRNLDLVITPDTSLAHLAGAIGTPVWMALPFSPDWRWLLDRDDSPWYPTMRLFRQRRRRDWDDVFARMAAELGSSGDRDRLTDQLPGE